MVNSVPICVLKEGQNICNIFSVKKLKIKPVKKPQKTFHQCIETEIKK